MKLTLTAMLASVFAAGVAMADPVEGVWQTEPDEGAVAHVQIAPCGAAFCGTILRSYKDGAAYKSPNIGKQIVREMAPAGGGNYNGKVFRPSNGKTYKGKIALKGDSMQLSGCVAGGLICSKQTWRRVGG